MSFEVLCIGHAAYDISFFVDDFPKEDSKAETEEVLQSCGGPAANAAYLLAKWGVQCAFAGLIGDDEYGRRIIEDLRDRGCDTTMIESRSDIPTPLSLIVVNRTNGSRTIINRTRRTHQLQLSQDRMPGDAPSVLLVDGHALPASISALQAYPNATSILDAGSWREGTAELAGRVDILAASERFALQATGLPDLSTNELQQRCLAELRERFPTTVVVTMGERGLIYRNDNESGHLPAFAVKAVDTTAAGDIFHGALAYAVLKKMNLSASLRFASLTAALSVESPGGRDSIPELTDVQSSIASHG